MKNTSRARLNVLADAGYIVVVLSQAHLPRVLLSKLPETLTTDDLNAAIEGGDAVFAWAAQNIGVASLSELQEGEHPSALFDAAHTGTLIVRVHRGNRILGILLHTEPVLSETAIRESLAAILTLVDEDGTAEIGVLAPRELAYLRKAMAGFTDEEIAADLNLSMRSVKERKKRTIKDLGAANLSHAVTLAKRSSQI